jgi:integral membrane protein
MNNLRTLKWLAIAEGISYLSFALTMPLKYMYDIPQPNYFVGMAHGVLFIAYCAFVVLVAQERKWKFTKTLIALGASLFPFATFILDKRMISPELEAQRTKQVKN